MTKRELKIQIGQNLYKYRIGCGLTRDEFSSAIGLSLSFYAAVENGKKGIHPIHLIKAADILKLDLDSLMRGEQDKKHINKINALLINQPEDTIDKVDKLIRLYVNELQ